VFRGGQPHGTRGGRRGTAASGAASQAKGRGRPPEATQPMTGTPGIWCTGGTPRCRDYPRKTRMGEPARAFDCGLARLGRPASKPRDIASAQRRSVSMANHRPIIDCGGSRATGTGWISGLVITRSCCLAARETGGAWSSGLSTTGCGWDGSGWACGSAHKRNSSSAAISSELWPFSLPSPLPSRPRSRAGKPGRADRPTEVNT
jgi:hypothetical protein